MHKAFATPLLPILLVMLLLCGNGQALSAWQVTTNRAHQETAAITGQTAQATAPDQLMEGLTAEYSKKANLVINHYVRAQQSFYHEKHLLALQEINSALDLIENADLLALKGAIYYGMGQYEEAASTFTRAFSLDKSLPLPRVAGLYGWLTDNNLMP